MTTLSYTPVTSEDILADLRTVLPHNTFQIISDFIHEIIASGSNALLSIGMIGTIWASSNGVVAIIKCLNKAYDEEETRPFWKVRVLSIVFTLALAIVILFSFIMLIFGQKIGERAFVWLHFPDNFNAVWVYAKYILSLVTMFTVFVYLYLLMLNRRLTFREVIPGSFFSTLGWIITSLLFSFYVNHFDSYTESYGSIGGIIVLLVWLYISSVIILFGGELNAALTFIRGDRSKNQGKKFIPSSIDILKSRR
jgi:membrane protein